MKDISVFFDAYDNMDISITQAESLASLMMLACESTSTFDGDVLHPAMTMLRNHILNIQEQAERIMTEIKKE